MRIPPRIPQAAPSVPAVPGREPPHSQEAEEHVIACCLLDGDSESPTIARAADLPPEAFYTPVNRLIFSTCLDLHRAGKPVMLETLGEELKTRRQLEAAGGYAHLTQISGRVPTTAHAGYFIGVVREKHLLREVIRAHTAAVEEAFGFSGGAGAIDELLQVSRARVEAVGRQAPAQEKALPARPLTAFEMPESGDPSVLIGDRWLSRGDIAILASTSGMGKSSLSLQAAVSWALGRDLFGGFRPARPLRSLIIQAEDGDGDIAEVRLSLEHAMALSDEDRKAVGERVLVVTDRIHRGLSFRAELARQIALHEPDIVWVNPLLAFIGGDVNDSTAVGEFLREQLNSLNEPAKFAYVIVHHTAKPPKDRKERQWNEVMYEMAGSADLTNAARAILALQATETPGSFRLIAAKRGLRAGLTERVPGKANPDIKFDRQTSAIGVRHSTSKFAHKGREIPAIFWERCDLSSPQQPKTRMGRPPKFTFDEFAKFMPKPGEPFLPPNQIHRKAAGARGISSTAFRELLAKAHAEGLIECREPAPGNVSYGYSAKAPVGGQPHDPVWSGPAPGIKAQDGTAPQSA